MITLKMEDARICLNCSPDAFGEINCSWEYANKFENDGNTPDGMDSGSQWTSVDTDNLIETSGSRNNRNPPQVEDSYEDSGVTSVATSRCSSESPAEVMRVKPEEMVPPPEICEIICTKKIDGELDC